MLSMPPTSAEPARARLKRLDKPLWPDPVCEEMESERFSCEMGQLAPLDMARSSTWRLVWQVNIRRPMLALRTAPLLHSRTTTHTNALTHSLRTNARTQVEDNALMFGEPPYVNRRASQLAWRLFPHLAGRARLRLLNESWSSVLELARFELSVFPGLLSCLRLHTWMHAFFMHVYLHLRTCAQMLV
jgi:hypothetical protein